MDCQTVYQELLSGYQDLTQKFPGDRTYADMLDRLTQQGDSIIPDDPFAIEVLDRIWIEKKSNFWADSLMRTAAFANMSVPPNYVNDQEVIMVAEWGDRIKHGTVPLAFLDDSDGGWVDSTGQTVTLEAPPKF